MTPLHHLHAEPAGEKSKRGAVSFDIGHDIRVRLDGGTDAQKLEAVRRLAWLWNSHEGIPTEVLERGVVREFYDAVQAMLDAADAESIDFATLLERARKVGATWEAITIELTEDGRRAACPCSERVQ